MCFEMRTSSPATNIFFLIRLGSRLDVRLHGALRVVAHGESLPPRSFYPPPPESGHLMCYQDRTSNLLPTLLKKQLDKSGSRVYTTGVSRIHPGGNSRPPGLTGC